MCYRQRVGASKQAGGASSCTMHAQHMTLRTDFRFKTARESLRDSGFFFFCFVPLSQRRTERLETDKGSEREQPSTDGHLLSV